MKNLGWSSKIKLDDGLKQTIPDFIGVMKKILNNILVNYKFKLMNYLINI